MDINVPFNSISLLLCQDYTSTYPELGRSKLREVPISSFEVNTMQVISLLSEYISEFFCYEFYV
jgi:hypothetical protein